MGEQIARSRREPVEGHAPATRKALTEREAFDRLTLALTIAGAPALVLSWIPAWLDRHHPLDVAAATPASAPVLTLSWIALALVVMGAVWAFLLPGLLLAARWGRANSLPMAMLLAVCAGIPTWALVTQLASGLHVAPGSAVFRGLIVATWGVAYAAGRWGSRTSTLAAPWVWGRDSRWQLLVTSGAILALALLLGPRLAWQAPSSDGAHLFETTRRLIVHGTPFWGSGWRGGIAAWPGLNTVAFVYPAAWHMYLLGAVDASVRVPFLLYLALVPFALIALASVRRTREPDRGIFLLAWLATLVYAVTVAYSATYDNYTVDVSLPSSQDTLFVVTILAFMVGYCEAKVRLLVPALVLSLVGLPSGIQITLMWLVLATVGLRPLQPKPIIATLALQRYARRGLAIDSTTRYLVQREEDPVPLGFTVHSVRAPFALLVNASVAPEMLSQRLPPGVDAIYQIPLELRFPDAAKHEPGVWYVRPRIEQWLSRLRRPSP